MRPGNQENQGNVSAKGARDMRREAVPTKPFRQASEYSYLIENIPAQMKELNQWVCWELRPNKDGVLIKMPVTSDTGCAARSNDSATWRSFDRAFEMFMKRECYAGLGFIFCADDNLLYGAFGIAPVTTSL